jgi:hypothetical protein
MGKSVKVNQFIRLGQCSKMCCLLALLQLTAHHEAILLPYFWNRVDTLRSKIAIVDWSANQWVNSSHKEKNTWHICDNTATSIILAFQLNRFITNLSIHMKIEFKNDNQMAEPVIMNDTHVLNRFSWYGTNIPIRELHWK